MDLITEYRKFAGLIDQCDNIEAIKEYQNSKTAIAMRNEFWKQRKIFFTSSDPLEKQKSLAKLQWLQQFFGSQIPIRRTINQFLAPNGLFGIFISSEATLGAGCVIFPHVNIGADTFPDSDNAGFPTIGEQVYIGAGSTIMGDVTIGNNVRIGPNCCITESIPDNCIVTAGSPCVVQKDIPPDNKYLSPTQFLDQRFSPVIYDYADHPGDYELITEKAVSADIDAIIQLYKDRMAWFRYKKIPQWGRYLEHHPREEFLQKIANGEYYVVKRRGEIISGFAISSDSENWMDDSPNACYLSRAVIKVGYKNLGDYVADEAKKLATAGGKELLRVECIYTNTRLNELWERLGFAFVRDFEGSYHAALREWDSRTDSQL